MARSELTPQKTTNKSYDISLRYSRLSTNELIIQYAALGMNGGQILDTLRSNGASLSQNYVYGYLRTPECLKGVRAFQERHTGQTVARVVTRLAGTQEASIGTLEDIRDGNMTSDPDGVPIRERREAASTLMKSFLNVAIGKSAGQEAQEREAKVNQLIESQSIELRRALEEERGIQEGEYQVLPPEPSVEPPQKTPSPPKKKRRQSFPQLIDPTNLAKELRRNSPPRYVEIG